MTSKSIIRRCAGLAVAVAFALAWTPGIARADHDDGEHYVQTNLVSDIPNLAMLTDPDLVNAWGVSFSATSPFWISDNGTGLATIYSVSYDASGKVSVAKAGLVVAVPGDGVSGQAFNSTSAFNSDRFLFVDEDGTIAGWRGALGTTAETLVPSVTGTVYKGLTLVSTTLGPVLLATNFGKGTLDAFDGNLHPLGTFTDSRAPAGYAPFNVAVIGGTIYVTFAKQDDAHHDDVKGPGNGLIDTFDVTSGKFKRFVTGSGAGGHFDDINSPWGLALAPMGFGKHGGDLLVGNFGSGTVMSFNPTTGKFHGLLKGRHEGPLAIDGLWALEFGNGGSAGRPSTLYFTAGPNGESDGLFGAIDPEPKPAHGDHHDHDDDD